MNHPFLIGDHRVRGNGDDGKVPETWFPSNPSRERQSVFGAELDVKQDGVRQAGLQRGERILQTLCCLDIETFGFQPIANQLEVRQIIFDYENSAPHDLTVTIGNTARFKSRSKASCQRSRLWNKAPAFFRM